MFTVGSSTSATFVLPVRHGTGVALQKRVWTVSQNPQSNRVANETPWQQWRRQGCCTERLWNQRMQIFYVEYDDQAEARATSSSRLDNSHWISFFYPASRHRCSIAEKSMDGFPKSSIEQSCKWDAMVTMKRARVLHRKALKPEDADILCGVWWPSWSTCNKQQPTWQFPLNKLFLPFRRNKVYASWQLDKASISVNRGSHFQVHFVWQVWDGQLSPAFKSIRLKAFGGWKFDRGTTKPHARILRGKGVQ